MKYWLYKCLLKLIVVVSKKERFAYKENRYSSILIIRLDEIGDMVMMSPFFRELRRWKPDAHITLVVKPAVHDLMKDCPYIDELILFEKQKFFN